MTTTAKLVSEITRQLNEKGVVVTVQPSITTSSKYLSFDYGVLKKARVGDHKGRGYHFTYEIGDHVQPPYETHLTYAGRPFTRYRYPSDKLDEMLEQVLIMRSNMRSKYGKEGYERIVARQKALA